MFPGQSDIMGGCICSPLYLSSELWWTDHLNTRGSVLHTSNNLLSCSAYLSVPKAFIVYSFSVWSFLLSFCFSSSLLSSHLFVYLAASLYLAHVYTAEWLYPCHLSHQSSSVTTRFYQTLLVTLTAVMFPFIRCMLRLTSRGWKQSPLFAPWPLTSDYKASPSQSPCSSQGSQRRVTSAGQAWWLISWLTCQRMKTQQTDHVFIKLQQKFYKCKLLRGWTTLFILM